MRIANPIYDAVFKYLMEDTEIARRFISRIIGEEITAVVVRPQEYTAVSEKHDITIFRLDFKATIKVMPPKGSAKKNFKPTYKTVLIELQKAKHKKDLQRFRRYLGENYRKKDVIVLANGKTEEVELPIITIYFLGFPMPPIKTSVIKINRLYIDLITQEVLDVKTEFIEKLTHDCYAILIKRLPKKERNELERLLKVFNQSFVLSDDKKLLEFASDEIDGDDLLKLVANRLRKAATDEDVLRNIEVEEEIEEVLDEHIREKEELKEEINEKQELISEQQEQLSEQQRIIAELKAQLKKK